jgi:serine/threonine-protein kinase HipA
LRECLPSKLDINTEGEFYLLAVLGSNLPGAVIIKSTGDKVDSPQNKPADDQRNRFNNILKFPLAGMQLKFQPVWKRAGH